MKFSLWLRAVLLAVLIVNLMPQSVSAQPPLVRVVLFYSPTCPHCHKIMTEDLPPLRERYGRQLVILEVNVAAADGQALYQTTLAQYQTPANRRGVPTLIIGDHYLVGSVEIPQQLPNLIATGLASGGIDWPEISGLKPVIDQQGLASKDSTPTAAVNTPAVLRPFVEAFNRDPAANTHAASVLVALIIGLSVSLALVFRQAATPAIKSWHTALLPAFAFLGIPAAWNLLQTTGLTFVLALVVLAGLVIQIVLSLWILWGKPSRALIDRWRTWAIPVLVVAGLAVASYLAFVEVTQSEAICGPVGDCNSVQHSEYARVFGFLPVAVLGLMGNLAVLVAWFAAHFGPARMRSSATWALWGGCLFGVVFSSYLTFLEAFIIGSTCMWCLNSAVLMLLLLWTATPLLLNDRAMQNQPGRRSPLSAA